MTLKRLDGSVPESDPGKHKYIYTSQVKDGIDLVMQEMPDLDDATKNALEDFWIDRYGDEAEFSEFQNALERYGAAFSALWRAIDRLDKIEQAIAEADDMASSLGYGDPPKGPDDDAWLNGFKEEQL